MKLRHDGYPELPNDVPNLLERVEKAEQKVAKLTTLLREIADGDYMDPAWVARVALRDGL